jgi:hypothetical protein
MSEPVIPDETERLRIFLAAAIEERNRVKATDRKLLLELAAAVSRMLRDYDRTQFPSDKDWDAHQAHAWKLDELANEIKKEGHP